MAKAGLSIVSTCEELAFPWTTCPETSERIDRLCRDNGVACVGTGVNPGFLMDFLPTVMTAVCQKVERVKVSRIQNASVRRVPFQQKIGAGLTLDQFQDKVSQGTLRHVGLTESMQMIAHRLGWKLDETTESLEPVIAEREITEGYTPIAKGQACGVEQIGRAFVNGSEVITLAFRAAVGESESFDRIEITGEPSLVSTIQGGVNGDTATCAIAVNAIRSILESSPGLRTMVDMPAVGYASAF